MIEPILTVPIEDQSIDVLLTKEWLVTNGLGGYASGTILGINTRRHHGVFVPNLPSPLGRTLLVSVLEETLIADEKALLSGVEFADRHISPDPKSLKSFRLDWNFPIWTFDVAGSVLEKMIWMPYEQNTVCITYKLLKGKDIQLMLRPFCTCRKQDSQLGYPLAWPFNVLVSEGCVDIEAFEGSPRMKMGSKFFHERFHAEKHTRQDVFYRLEYQRGLDYIENIFSPGYFNYTLKSGDELHFLVSTEDWEKQGDLNKVFDDELKRRQRLLDKCRGANDDLLTAQLVLAADQFIVLPKNRQEEHACTVIAGYHWFTDWGRDTMISLEGLTLTTGRTLEARAILATFAKYVHHGLLPNHFLEGERNAVYNTVDATFWYFHALDRYLQTTKDMSLLHELYPTLVSIIDYHLQGTDFGIHVEAHSGLISASAPGYQLTWMDAKVDEWVVTPRRGKPVEIQALWFNALKLMEAWAQILGQSPDRYTQLSQKVFDSFNARFWYEEGGYLYDVIDTSKGDDSSFRPNQIFTISLAFPILKQESWKPVVDLVHQRLVTPYGLRTLEPTHKEYHSKYEGSRWNRDAAYHQGLVWAWLIGPFLDASQRAHPGLIDRKTLLAPFREHLLEAGIGSISEIFDAQEPYRARGCIAQAWSVAEVLRCL